MAEGHWPRSKLHVDEKKKFILLFSSLSSLGHSIQSSIDWVAYKQQPFICCSSATWEVQDPGAGRFCVWCLVHRRPTFCYALTWQKEEGSPLGTLYKKGTDPLMRGSHSWPNHLPKSPPPNTIISGTKFQHMNGGGKHSVCRSPWNLQFLSLILVSPFY